MPIMPAPNGNAIVAAAIGGFPEPVILERIGARRRGSPDRPRSQLPTTELRRGCPALAWSVQRWPGCSGLGGRRGRAVRARADRRSPVVRGAASAGIEIWHGTAAKGRSSGRRPGRFQPDGRVQDPQKLLSLQYTLNDVDPGRAELSGLSPPCGGWPFQCRHPDRGARSGRRTRSSSRAASLMARWRAGP